MNNITSLINLKLKNKDLLVEKVDLSHFEKKAIENLLINILLSSPSATLEQVRKILNEDLLKENEEINTTILRISTVDEKTYKLRLKKQYQEHYDPYIFYKIPTLQEEAENNLNTKGNERIDLVSGIFEAEIPPYLRVIQNNLYQSELPDFLSLFIRKLSKANYGIIQPVLKLILQNLQIINEIKDISIQNEGLLKKVEENYMQNDFINGLENIRKDPELIFFRLCVEKILYLLKVLARKYNYQGLEFVINENEILDPEEERKKLAKERMENKKVEFAKKQALFADKNLSPEESKDSKSSPELLQSKDELICQHCLERIDENHDDYGVPGTVIMTNNFDDINKKNVFIENDNFDLLKQNWWVVFSSCRHPYHKNCFTSQIWAKKDKCPLCKAYSNIFIPQSLQSIQNSSEFTLQILDCLEKHCDKIREISLYSLFEVHAEGILRRALSYFIESFHLHSQFKSLKPLFELYSACFRSFNALYENKQESKPENLSFSLLEKISQREISCLRGFQVESLLNDIFADILIYNFPDENNSISEEELNQRYILILKEYLLFKISQSLSFVKEPPTTLNECFLTYNKDDKLKKEIIKELIFPVQKILLAMNLNKSINSRSFNPSTNFYQLLCQNIEDSSLYLTELFHEVGFSFTYEELIEEVFLELPKVSSCQKVLISLLPSKSTEIGLAKPKMIKFAPRMVKLPQTFAEFTTKYIKSKCNYCKEYGKFANTAICLICEEKFCTGYCSEDKKLSIGNLNHHAQKAHFGISTYLMISSLETLILSSPTNIPLNKKNAYVDNLGQPIEKFLENQDEVHLVDFKNFCLDSGYEEKLKQICNNHSMMEECVRLASLSDKQFNNGAF